MRIFHNIILTISIIALFFACEKKEKHLNIKVERFVVDSTYDAEQDTSIVNLIFDYKRPIENEMNKVIAYSEIEMPKYKKPEGLLSNYISDLYYNYGTEYCKNNLPEITIDGAIMNIHGLRTSLPKGNITVGRIYEIMPFDNKLMIIKMQGKHLRKLFDHIARVGGEGVSNITLSISKKNKLSKSFINKKPIDDDKIYHIVTIDYLINGGNGMTAFKNNAGTIDMNIMCRDAIIEYLQQETSNNRKITSKLDRRIYYENK